MDEQVIISPQPGPQEDFINLPNDMEGEKINIAFYGGAAGGGKSYALLMDSLKYIDDPNYYAVYFRRTTGQLERSLWPEAKEMFLPFLVYPSGPRRGKWIGKARIQEQKHRIVFPSGATIDFSYMENDKDAQLNWQGGLCALRN